MQGRRRWNYAISPNQFSRHFMRGVSYTAVLSNGEGRFGGCTSGCGGGWRGYWFFGGAIAHSFVLKN